MVKTVVLAVVLVACAPIPALYDAGVVCEVGVREACICGEGAGAQLGVERCFEKLTGTFRVCFCDAGASSS